MSKSFHTKLNSKLYEKLDEAECSNCCGASDIYDGNLDNNGGVCADCGEHCIFENDEGDTE